MQDNCLGQMVPLLWALLPNKAEITYERLLGLIQREADRIGLTFKPKAFQIDFEKAVINAIGVIFPHANIRGCFFHFSQCLWRKIQELGLSLEYKTDGSALRSYVKAIQCLALCPLDLIDEAWDITALLEPVGVKAQEFTTYFLKTWLLPDAKFRREFWNHFEHDGARTTNNLEGYHHALNKLVGAAHPNIYKFIDIIKNSQKVANLQNQRSELAYINYCYYLWLNQI